MAKEKKNGNGSDASVDSGAATGAAETQGEVKEKQKRPRKPKKFMLITNCGSDGTEVQEIEGEDTAFTEYAKRAQSGLDVTCYQVEKVELLLSARRA